MTSNDEGRIGRRDFLRGAAALGTLPAWIALSGRNSEAAVAQAASAGSQPILDLAEWTYGYIGMETVTLPRGELLTGKNIYVEFWVPRQIRHPYPIVLVHGGTGQGLDWMATPDGRRGWALQLVEQGYKVCVVDRPGQGRPPYVPDLHGAFSPQAPTYEAAEQNVSALAKRTTAANPLAQRHTQWPGTGEVGDPALDHFLAAQGPAVPSAAGAEGAWRFSGSKLLDEIGPAIILTHGDSSALAWIAADERPTLVKGIVVIEPVGPTVVAGGGGRGAAGGAARAWGLTATAMAFEPPASAPADLRLVPQTPSEVGIAPFVLQTEPARRLKNLAGVPVAVVTAEASAANQRDPGTVSFLRQGGCTVDHLRLVDAGVRGNGPYPMMERNSREALQPILAWIDRRVNPGAPAIIQAPTRPNSDSTALRLAEQGYFFVGVDRKKVAYGTVAVGQSGVQSFIPVEVRHPNPIVLVHGGLGQAAHMMGIGRRPGWVHYFVREGYRVYVMDRPACGRVPLHPDTFGADYLAGFGGGTNLANILRNSATAPGNPRNTGLRGEELGLQFVANESGLPRRMAEHSEHWAKGAVELIEKIGPAIVLTHAFGGCLGWIAADRRPSLVKALVTVEGNNNPFEGEVVWGVTAVPLAYDPPVSDPKDIALADWTPPVGSPGPNRAFRIQAEPARKLKNLAGIPILWMQGENNYSGPAQVQFLKQSGCDAEFIRLRDLGIVGNTNLMLLERNNFEVFGVIRDWLARRATR
ncbi:MAG: hypothetical protein A3H95_17440 [Acidobacteria bacterium RIFCSPLOWO2_02_FULL_64_15]|nr:MAG: hypothetical protein A3H95_17440 [Acidobacteria bacterium RIFCSPLOWO2_02_FULL_64_15]